MLFLQFENEDQVKKIISIHQAWIIDKKEVVLDLVRSGTPGFFPGRLGGGKRKEIEKFN